MLPDFIVQLQSEINQKWAQASDSKPDTVQQSPIGDATPYVTLQDGRYSVIISERGTELARHSNLSLPQVVQFYLEQMARAQAQRDELAARAGYGGYSRWNWMQPSVALLDKIGPSHGDALWHSYAQTLAAHPLQLDELQATRFPFTRNAQAASGAIAPARDVMLRYANLALLILFPIAWFAPLIRAALLPVFGMDEISVMTGLQSLWGSDAALALVVTFLAVFAPFAKTLGLALIHFGLLSPKTLPALNVMGKLAMADVFLIALYIVIVKGAGYVTIEVAWGLYLFTACILASLWISHLTAKGLKAAAIAGT